MNIKRCCSIIGEPPMCYVWGYDEEDQRCLAMKLLLLNRISGLRTAGILDYYVPLDPGVGLYASELILSLMESDPQLRLHSIIPYEDQATKWSPNLRDRYYDILEKGTDSAPVSLQYTPTCELDARLEAIDVTSVLMTVSAKQEPQDSITAVSLRYAEKTGKCIIRLISPTL